MSEETTESTSDAPTESASPAADAPAESASPAADAPAESASTAADSSETGSAADTGRGSVLGDQFGRWVNYLLLAGLSLVVLIAGFRVYLAIDALIRRFVAREFQQVFYGVFNLALLLLAVAGILVQRRRMR